LKKRSVLFERELVRTLNLNYCWELIMHREFKKWKGILCI
jgi:hypothetical protein